MTPKQQWPLAEVRELVEKLLRDKADAWDEGYVAGVRDGREHSVGLTDNPYRAYR